MLANVGSENAGCRECFAAVDAFVRTLSTVNLYMHDALMSVILTRVKKTHKLQTPQRLTGVEQSGNMGV